MMRTYDSYRQGHKNQRTKKRFIGTDEDIRQLQTGHKKNLIRSRTYVNPLTTKNEKFADFRETSRGMLSSELFEFLKYLYPFKRYAKFSFFGFFNSARLFENLFSRKLQCL